ncbi:hypothetical protein [Ferrimonas pelagia]|uniref:Chemotaxis protein n=1 Tax=Ferrimonas pelagia TaxID=1177826 RepID=A0ABP9ETU4_9GAMM
MLRILFSTLLLSTLMACSLLEINLDSGIEPLPEQALQQRIITREFLREYNANIDSSADRIQQHSTVPEIQLNAIRWQLAARQAGLKAVYQTQPEAALMDLWLLLAQQHAFFDSAKGSALFAEHSAIALTTSHELLQDYRIRAKPLLSSRRYQQAQGFVTTMSQAQPLQDIRFQRPPAYPAWLAWQQLEQVEAVDSYGTLPQVMTDLAERIQALSEQAPKTLVWQTQLLASESQLDAEAINLLLLELRTTLHELQQLTADDPDYLKELAASMTQPLIPAAAKLDLASQRLSSTLQAQRVALEHLIERERLAFGSELEQQRRHTVDQLEVASNRVLTSTLEQVQRLIKSTILYVLLLLLVILFAPFGFGYWLGSRRGKPG